jgi:hypothetical protein
LGLGWLQPAITVGYLKHLAYLTLALNLFIDAANANLGVPRRSFSTPDSMLLPGLPVSRKYTHKLLLAAVGSAEVLTLLTWIVFGTAVLGYAFDYSRWQVVVYALLSLTLIRMPPISFALTATDEKTGSPLFLSWFGPRRLASVVYCHNNALQQIATYQAHCSYRGMHDLIQRTSSWCSGQSTRFGIC